MYDIYKIDKYTREPQLVASFYELLDLAIYLKDLVGQIVPEAPAPEVALWAVFLAKAKRDIKIRDYRVWYRDHTDCHEVSAFLGEEYESIKKRKNRALLKMKTDRLKEMFDNIKNN